MPHDVDMDLAAHVVIPYFLRTLMKAERERLGATSDEICASAGLTPFDWESLEAGVVILQPQQWQRISSVLGLGNEEAVRRLDAFVEKHPEIWLERTGDGEITVCERALTSPRPMRSGNVFGIDLERVRPNLYYELSAYSSDPQAIVDIATRLGLLEARDRAHRSTPARPPGRSDSNERREHLARMLGGVSDEKLGLLERMIDKFNRFDSDDLAHAYKHFSLSLSRK